jgi:hypothetical protein
MIVVVDKQQEIRVVNNNTHQNIHDDDEAF